MTSDNVKNIGKMENQNMSSSEQQVDDYNTKPVSSIKPIDPTEENHMELSENETNQLDFSQFLTQEAPKGIIKLEKVGQEENFDSQQYQEKILVSSTKSGIGSTVEDTYDEVNLSPFSSAEVELDSNDNDGIEISTKDSILKNSNLVEYFPDLKKRIIGIEQGINDISTFSHKIVLDIKEIHKLYHTEYAGRLQSMQNELEQYREKEKGRFFDDILKEIASLYTTYESIIDKIVDEKIKREMTYLFDDILQILQANGVSKQKSNLGNKRNTRHCQVVERIETDDPNQHDTIAQSCGTGFYIDNRNLVKEPVKIYLYSEVADGKMD